MKYLDVNIAANKFGDRSCVQHLLEFML